MKHLGDYDTSTVIYGKFSTFRPSTGAAYTLGGTPALSVYKDNSVTQSTTGVTLTADFDSVTGLNHFAIDTSADGAFYAAGSFFDIIITTGTVDSVSVVGSVVASFTLRKNSALKPTTAGRTLDVSAGGEAGIDWANVGSPTTAVNLSATNIDVDQVVASVSGNVGGDVIGSVASVTGNVTGSVGSVVGLTASDVGDIKTKTDQLVFTTANQVDATAITISTGAVSAAALATDAVNEIADGLLDRNMATGTDSGSTTVRTPRQALRAVRNKVAIAAGTATIYKEDDATSSWTAAVTTTAGDPISAVDPAGP